MMKLDEAIEHYSNVPHGANSQLPVILGAAESYAAIMKLAPEIGRLVEAGEHIAETAHNATIRDDYDVPPHKALALLGCDGDLLAIFEGDYGGSDRSDAKFFIAAANARPALKAIHEILMKFGKDAADA